MHHSPFFWIATFFIFAAMVIYVLSNNLATGPGGMSQKSVPAIAP